MLSAHLAAQGIYGGGKRQFGFDIVEDGDQKRLVPNAAEQAVLAPDEGHGQAGATYCDIAAATGRQPMTAKRILDRT